MKIRKLLMLYLAVCGLIALPFAPGIAAAAGPISPTGFIPRADNTYYLPNTGGGAGPEWGPYVGVDCHGDASPFMRDPNGWTSGPLYNGLVLTWGGPSSTLPTGLGFNKPFDFNALAQAQFPSLIPPAGVPSTLHDLLTIYGPLVNDMVWFDGGLSAVNVISLPFRSLPPFETSNNYLQVGLWNGLDYWYNNTPIVVIPADLSQVYTKYVAQDLTWPGWDPTVPDRDYYAGYEQTCDRVTGVCSYEPRYNTDYPAPSTSTQYIFYIQNDIYTVAEPGTLLLFGCGLIGLVGVRRATKKQ